MKLIHLADLHIGKNLKNLSLLEEQQHAFRQIIDYIKSEKPDVVLIAGDVYDRTVPSIEAVHLFDDFLTSLAKHDVTVIVISGNHDSPERLNFASRLLSERKLHICGVFDGTMRSVTLTDTYGSLTIWMLPFIKPSNVRGLYADKEMESYTSAINVVLEEASIDYHDRNILLTHQFYSAAGFSPIRSESEIDPIGGLDAVDAGILSGFDYVALGHLHGEQEVKKNMHYAGSPVKYSFSEWKHKKSATLVEIKEKGDLTVTLLPIIPLHDMREIKGPLEQLLSDKVSSAGNKEDYLRVILTDEDEIIDPMEKIRVVYPNVLVLDYENSRTNKYVFNISQEIEQLDKLSPYELFSEFFLEMSGGVMSEEQSQIVRELFEKEREE